MDTFNLQDFKIVDEMRADCIYGPIQGKQACEVFKDAVNSKGQNNIWQISLKGAICTHYQFFTTFLSPILTNHCEFFPKNIGLSIDCSTHFDRDQILSGVGTIIDESGKQVIGSEEEAICNIKKNNRFFNLITYDKNENLKFEYIGTDSSDHQALLNYLDREGPSTSKEIHKKLNWNSVLTIKELEILLQRRHIFIIGDVSARDVEPKYVSIAYIIRNRGANGSS